MLGNPFLNEQFIILFFKCIFVLRRFERLGNKHVKTEGKCWPDIVLYELV